MNPGTKKQKINKLIYPKLSFEISGLLYETHNTLGRYHNEKEYGDFLENILTKSNINFQRELSPKK